MPRDSGRSRQSPPSPGDGDEAELQPSSSERPAGSLGDIVYRAPGDLIPYARNTRTHSDQQIRQIRASMDQFGFTNPILLREDGKRIGAGHGRQLAALLDPPLAKVPTLIVYGLSDAEWRALIIADNKLALNAGWDSELLGLELAELNAGGFDIALIGFDEHELADLTVTHCPDGNTDPDAIPETPKHPVSALGDLWILGDHRLLCGDSTTIEAKDAAGAMDCAATVSDPPYGIGYEYAEHDDSDNGENAQLVADAFSPGPEAIIWTPGLNNLGRDLGRFGKTKVLVWSKRFAAAGSGLGGASTWEPVLVAGTPPARKLKNDVIEVMTDREQLNGESLRKFHSCPKPVGLYQQLLEGLTIKGQMIFEPFSGSGTTIMACERSGRRCRAIEISPAYVDVAIQRWMAFTGKPAVLESTGETFAELLEKRRPQAASKPKRARP